MQINSQDNSTGAELKRLQAEQAALQERLARLEPAAKAPKPDLKAERAEEAARRKAIAALQEKLTAWKAQSAAIDKLVADLCEMVKAERETRAGIVTAHRDLIEKEHRRALSNDQAIISGLQGMIGDTLRPRTDSHDNTLADLSGRYAAMIIQALGADDIDELLS